MCVRNDAIYLRSALAALIDEGLDVVLIDHDSSEPTRALARRYLGRGLLGIERLPWRGRFSLAEQLEAKRRVAAQVDHDWIVHVDADEWLSAPHEGQTLLDGLRAADEAGFNCVNFNELVFVPRPGEDLFAPNYRARSLRYYFYRPLYPFLMRAWKKDAGLDNRTFAGHLLTGDVRMCPLDFPLRHYIVLSEAHAARKYATRHFDAAEIRLGWHQDRVLAQESGAAFPADDALHRLAHWSSKDFDLSAPRARHFWEWDAPEHAGERARIDERSRAV